MEIKIECADLQILFGLHSNEYNTKAGYLLLKLINLFVNIHSFWIRRLQVYRCVTSRLLLTTLRQHLGTENTNCWREEIFLEMWLHLLNTLGFPLSYFALRNVQCATHRSGLQGSLEFLMIYVDCTVHGKIPQFLAIAWWEIVRWWTSPLPCSSLSYPFLTLSPATT